MNKKEIIIVHKFIDGELKCILDNNSYENLMLAIKTYEKENKKYDKELKKCKKRINKAIERIEQELSYTPSSTRKEVGLILVDYKKLLDILKGEE